MTGMPRPSLQFRLSTIFWLTFAAACFFGGTRFERANRNRQDERTRLEVENAFRTMPTLKIPTTMINEDDRDDRDTTRGWRKGHAEAIETRGFG